MLNHIDFKPMAPVVIHPRRRDVVCFIGHVKRRVGQPPPAAVREQIQGAGWPLATERGTDSVGVTADRLEDLLNLPVVLESWSLFDQLFAWDHRPVRAGSTEFCASYLGSAVRSFFTGGGRRAVVVRVGDPWPFLDPGRPDQWISRLRRILPSLTVEGTDAPSTVGSVTEPLTWHGIEHLFGLPDVSHLCLPDLSDCCALDPTVVAPSPPQNPPPEVFVECSDTGPYGSSADVENSLSHLELPRLDHTGFERWGAALAETARFLRTHRRDTIFLGHLPLPLRGTKAGEPPIHAISDPHEFLVGAGLWRDRPSPPAGVERSSGESSASIESAFVQLGWPWLRAVHSDDLPAHLEPPDGILAGLIARNARNRGTHRSIAGSRLDAVVFLEPVPAMEAGIDGPMSRLAERVCLVGPSPDGFRLLSDVTTSPQLAWRSGGVSRMFSSLWRAVQQAGEIVAFEPNAPPTWAVVRRRLENLLGDWWRRGALGGRTSAEAFRVRCDRTTMSQADLDQGRIRAEVGVLPARAVERITVVLDLQNGGVRVTAPEVVP